MTSGEGTTLHWTTAAVFYLLAKDSTGLVRAVMYAFMGLHLFLMVLYFFGWAK